MVGKKFIWVFKEEDKKTLELAGYILLKEVLKGPMWIFANDENIEIDLSEMRCYHTDLLIF